MESTLLDSVSSYREVVLVMWLSTPDDIAKRVVGVWFVLFLAYLDLCPFFVKS